VLDDELRDILRDLRADLGARSVSIEDMRTDEGLEANPKRRVAALGDGAELVVDLPSDATVDDLAAIERASRAIRSSARRWNRHSLPRRQSTYQESDRRGQVIERMRTYLLAFCGSTDCSVAVVVHRGTVLATSAPLSDLEESRLTFIVRQADAEAKSADGTSHAAVFGDDFFAATFYFGAVLIAFAQDFASRDFTKHHAKRVSRELVHLIELLDDGPPDPAAVAPV
jgi:hypothetical protein